jgi:hypothetical protein
METSANTRWSCTVEGTSKAPVLREGSAAYQLVGRVTAYQGEDG